MDSHPLHWCEAQHYYLGVFMYRLDLGASVRCWYCIMDLADLTLCDYHTQLQRMREELLANAATTDAQAALVELDQS